MQTLLPVADEGMAAVDHGGDEDAVGDRTDFARGNVGEDMAGKVATATFEGQVFAYPRAGGAEGRGVEKEGLHLFRGRHKGGHCAFPSGSNRTCFWRDTKASVLCCTPSNAALVAPTRRRRTFLG